MANLEDLRKRFPQYSDVSDGDFLMGLRQKFYPNVHPRQFFEQIDGAANAHVTIRKPEFRKIYEHDVQAPIGGETEAETQRRLYGSAEGPTFSAGPAAAQIARSGLQGLTFGAGDEIVAAGASALSPRTYAEELARERGRLELGRELRPKTAFVAELGGALAVPIASSKAVGTTLGRVAQGAGLGGLGTRFFGTTLGRMTGGALAAGLGAGTYGFGIGQGGFKNRAESAAKYGALGGAVGFATPIATAGIRSAGRAIGDTVGGAIGGITGRGSLRRANRALAAGLQRSGSTADDIAKSLSAASREGQPAYAVVDAMGVPGKRMLSGIARSGGDASTEVVEYLNSRQLGQGERVSGFIQDAFGATDSAAAREAALRVARGKAADVAYDAARSAAGPVDLSRAIGTIDDYLGLNHITKSSLKPDSIGSRLWRIRDRIFKGKEQLVDFDSVLKLKTDLLDEISTLQRAGKANAARELRKVSGALDAALEASSDGYRAANDGYRAASGVIEAVGEGQRMARPGARAADTVRRFEAMTPAERAAARVGYGDKLLASVERKVGEGSNKARQFTSAKFAEEIASMADDPALLARRLARENEMFGTRARATGGSLTADNLADIGGIQKFDAGVLQNILSGRFGAAGAQLAQRGLNAASGMNSPTRKIIADALLSGDTRALQAAAKGMERGDANKVLIDTILRVIAARGGVVRGAQQDNSTLRPAQAAPALRPIRKQK